MTQFFKPKKQPGRPGKKTSQAGRPTTEKVQPSAAEAVKATTGQPKTKKQKKTRQNWSKGEGFQRMTEAVSVWNEELSKPENERLAMRLFAEKSQIPYATFQEHVTKNEAKRIKLGNGVGRKPTR